MAATFVLAVVFRLVLAALAFSACLAFVAFFAWLLQMPPQPPKRRPSPNADWTKRPGLDSKVAEQAPATGLTYLVIGTGSVGLLIAETLIKRGEKRVAGFDSVAPKRPVTGMKFVQGDVCDITALLAACEGVDVVYATVALIRYYERLEWQYSASHAVNVVGTANIVQACVECGVRVLVQTSTSNVCVGAGVGGTELTYARWCARAVPPTKGVRMDETSPTVDASTSPNHYGWSKVQAEKLVLEANGASGRGGRKLATGAIRPCSAIFGPADNFITERWLDQGQFNVIFAQSVIDYVFVENVVFGHLLLEAALLAGPAGGPGGPRRPTGPGGRAYCISNDEPMSGDDFYNAVKVYHDAAVGTPFEVFYLPIRVMTAVAYGVELYGRLTRCRPKGDLASLTPAMLDVAGLSYQFSCARAADELGYAPLYNVDEAVQRTVHLWQKQRQPPS